MSQRSTILSDATTLSVGLVVMLIGLAFWVGGVHAMSIDTAADLSKLQTKVELQPERLARIEAKLELILDAVQNPKTRRP